MLQAKGKLGSARQKVFGVIRSIGDLENSSFSSLTKSARAAWTVLTYACAARMESELIKAEAEAYWCTIRDRLR